MNLDLIVEVMKSGHTVVNDENEILIEYWYKEKSLSIFIRDDKKVDYLRCWGSNIHDDMDDGEVQTFIQYIELLEWLIS